MSKKSPAFQFYPGDWLSSMTIQMMTPEEEGAYIRLLCYDWSNDGIPDNEHALATLSRLNDRWNLAANAVKKAFLPHPEKSNTLTNPRLLEERAKQAEFREQRVRAGRNSAKKRKNLSNPTSQRALKSRSTLVGVSLQRDSNSSSSSSSSSSDSTNTKVLVPPYSPKSKSKPKVEPSPLLPDCEFFRATFMELETAKTTWCNRGNLADDFSLAIAEVEFWLGTETTSAKKARTSKSHTRHIFAAWVAENIGKRHAANRKFSNRAFPSQQLTRKEKQKAELMQLIADTEHENENGEPETARIL